MCARRQVMGEAVYLLAGLLQIWIPVWSPSLQSGLSRHRKAHFATFQMELFICISPRYLSVCPYLQFGNKCFIVLRPLVIYGQRNVNRMWSHMKGLTAVHRRSGILITPLARSLNSCCENRYCDQFSSKPDLSCVLQYAKGIRITQCNETRRIYLHKTFCFVSGSCCCSSV